jgi:hypothetical protein
MVAVVLAAFAVLFGPSVVHRQILGLGATDIHLAALLPDQISVCGRDWTKSQSNRQFDRSDIQAAFGVAPSLVDPLPFPPCPSGPCTNVA